MRSRWSTLIVNHSRSARAGLSAAAVTIGLGGAFGALTAFAPTASATPAPGLGADFSCLATDIYGVAGPTIYDYQTASIDGSAVTGTAASTDLPSGDSLNAFGISPGGTMAYAVDTSTKHVEQYDPVSETWTDLGAVPAGVSAIKGAVDPLNGDFYFSGSNNEFYEYDPTTNTTSTTAVSITNVSGTGNGDAAFDAQGDLYLVATNSLAFVTAAQLAAGGSEAATVVSTGVLSGGSGPNGIAFTSDGKLYISTSSDLYQISSATGDVIAGPSSISQSIVDLATCQYPPSLSVQANIDSRAGSGDQFGLAITGGGLANGNTTTTSGTATGDQPQIVGPLPALATTTYTFTETAADGTDLSDYDISASCVDTADGNASIATTTVSSTSFTVDLPAAAGANGQVVLCTFYDESLPTITSSAFTAGEQGVAYSETATGSAGSTPYSWSETGTLPPGLSLDSSTGVLSGTPTTAGTYPFSLTLTDANSNTATQSESITIASSPTITSAAFSGGEVGVSYLETATASGGTGPYTWSTTNGSVPSGLTLDTSTGVLSGTPTTAGTYTFDLVVTDADSQTATQDESIGIGTPSITSAPFPGGEVGASYSETATASGGAGPYTWSTTDGSVPPGLTLDTSTGVLSGTPTTAGTYTFDLVVTDADSQTATQDESVTITSGPSITSAALAGGEVAVAYSETATASGGTGLYTWSTSNGSVPPGLSLDTSTGVVSGSPTTAGPYTFDLVVTDADGQTATQDESVTIASAPTITSAAFPGGEVGVAYSDTATASGGTGPYTWSTTNGSVPSGLTLDTSTGVLSGTPTTAGTYTFDLVVTDADSQTATQDESIGIGTPSITSSPLPGGENGVAYSETATASGGTGPYTWSVTGGTLPPGLTLDPSTGVVSGTPTTNGTYTFDLVVTDADSQTATQDESVVIGSGPSITSAALPGGEKGEAYSETATSSGGTGPYTWSVTSGTLPPGLTLNPSTGVVSGTPITAGTYSFDLVVTDAGSQTATQDESVVIAGGPSITSASLPGGEGGVAYSQTATASGGTGPYTWSVTGGTLPPGLTLDPSTGVISGTPTTAGTYTFDLVVTDADGQTATQSESVVIGNPAITSSALPGGEQGEAYSETATASGGTGPYTWSVTSGTLPPGLTLNPSTGVVSGTPTTAGTYPFDLVVTDAKGKTATQSETVVIAGGPSITSPVLAGGEAGLAYSETATASGGTTPYTWSVTSGTLPPGLTLDSSTGVVSGTPTTAGTYPFDLVVTDADGQTATQSESVVIGAPAITSPTLAGGEVGVAYSETATASGGTAPYTWSLTGGSLPPGLSLDPSTGVVSGTPTTAGTYTFDLVVTDADGQTAVQTESVTISAAPLILSPGLPSGSTTTSYAVTPTVQGVGPYTWSTFGALPPGLTLNTHTGAITGDPTTPGTYKFLLIVTDAAGRSVSQPETVVITAPAATTTTTTTTTTTVPAATTPTATATSGALPLTGIDIAGGAGIGMGLILVGSLLAVLGRRRSRTL